MIAMQGAILIIGGCRTALFPAQYAITSLFVRESIELNSDHTFTYHSMSDDGPTSWDATGTWEWVSQKQGIIETRV